jgi:hypothetical protein
VPARLSLPTLGLLLAFSLGAQATTNENDLNHWLALTLTTLSGEVSSAEGCVQALVEEEYSRRGVEGVPVSFTVEREDGRRRTAERVTDAFGVSVFCFAHGERGEWGTDLTIEASISHRGQERSAEASVWVAPPRLVLSTDKVRYRPGQELRARALSLGEPGIADSAIATFRLTRGDERVFEEAVEFSARGIASVSWTLPPTLAPGRYTLVCQQLGGFRSQTYLSVGPYESPVFQVSARPTGDYFLPQDPVEIDVSVETLAGLPVPRATIRVMEDHAEDVVGEATADEGGRARVTLGVRGSPEESDEWEPEYRDLDLLVEARDPRSGRVEVTPVAVRLSRDPIHIYVLGLDADWMGWIEKPLVTLSSAAGETVVGTVRLTGWVDDAVVGQELTLETNRYGIAEIPESFFEQLTAIGADEFRVQAEDGGGGRGEKVFWQDRYADDTGGRCPLCVATQATLLDSDEAIDVEIRVARPLKAVWVQLVNCRGEVLESHFIPQIEAVRRFRFAGHEAENGALWVYVYTVDAELGGATRAAAPVLYASEPRLDVSILGPRGPLSPGDAGRLQLRVRDGRGEGTAAVLGVLALDAAIAGLRDETTERLGISGFLGDARWATEGADAEADQRLAVLASRHARGEGTAEDQLLARFLLLRQTDWWVGTDTDTQHDADARALDRHFRDSSAVLRAALARAGLEPALGPTARAEGLTRWLAAQGVDLARMRDPWDRPYRWEVVARGPWRFLRAVSDGRDGIAGSHDDHTIRSHFLRWDSTRGIRSRVNARLNELFAREGRWVRTADEFEALIGGLEIDRSELEAAVGGEYWVEWRLSQGRFRLQLAPRGQRYPTLDFSFSPRQIFHDLVKNELERRFGVDWRLAGTEAIRAAILDILSERSITDPEGRPLTVDVPESNLEEDADTAAGFVLRSVGGDGVIGTADDGLFLRVIVARGTTTASRLESLGSGWAIQGEVVDEQGHALPGVVVTLRSESGREAIAATDAEGAFSFYGGVPGEFHLAASLDGFSRAEYPKLSTSSGRVTYVELMLRVDVEETITVTSEAPLLETRTLSTGTALSVAEDSGPGGPRPPRPSRRVTTPRLRRDFPEVMMWLPEVETDAAGVASIDFEVPDSITTWRLAVIASTNDARIAIAQADLRATLPLSTEPDLPIRLTVGDRIEVPVLTSNLSGAPQEVTLEVLPSGEIFKRLIEDRGTDRVDARFVASRPGSLPFEVVATSREFSDRVLKEAEAVEFGRLEKRSQVALLSDGQSLDAGFPKGALPGTSRARVRIYADLSSQLQEATAALLARPRGCGEQTISSAYPSVLWLQIPAAKDPRNAATAKRAEEYVGEALRSLARFQNDDGGFAYWERESSDPALSAHAVEFLLDAREVVAVDDELAARSVDYLIRTLAVGSPGSFTGRGGGRAAVSAAVTLRTLARAQEALGGEAVHERIGKVLDVAVGAVAARSDFDFEPAMLAPLAEIAHRRGDLTEARRIEARLLALAKLDQGGASWTSNYSSPYYGWGRAGDIETTASVLEALELLGSRDGLATRKAALAYLLVSRDADGAWYSSQATVRALRALVASLGDREEVSAGEYRVTLNGTELELRRPTESMAESWEGAVDGSVTLQLEAEGPSPVLIQVVLEYRTPWAEAAWASEDALGALDYAVFCQNEGLAVDESGTCRVEAQRFGAGARGMLVAEIGLPPGAVVDRPSLDAAVKSSPRLSRYEVWPDRVVAYLWPQSARLEFSFEFSSRFPLVARSAPSRLYDYYNPEAQVVLRPRLHRVGRASGLEGPP